MLFAYRTLHAVTVQDTKCFIEFYVMCDVVLCVRKAFVVFLERGSITNAVARSIIQTILNAGPFISPKYLSYMHACERQSQVLVIRKQGNPMRVLVALNLFYPSTLRSEKKNWIIDYMLHQWTELCGMYTMCCEHDMHKIYVCSTLCLHLISFPKWYFIHKLLRFDPTCVLSVLASFWCGMTKMNSFRNDKVYPLLCQSHDLHTYHI